MYKISTILLPFDFSNTSLKALDYAVSFVGRNDNIKIVLAFISERPNLNPPTDTIKEIDEKYNGVLKNKLKWVTKVGPLTQSLLEIQKTMEVDLVIMGTLGANKRDDTEHSNTSELVLAAECPVLVVPHDYKDFQLKRMALVLGKEEIDQSEVLGTLLAFARRFNAKVYVVTIENLPSTYGYSEEEEKNENTMEYYLENFYEEHVFIKNKDVVDGILTYTSKKEIDLIAILPRNHTKHSKPSKGQLTQLLIQHSKLPVLAID